MENSNYDIVRNSCRCELNECWRAVNRAEGKSTNVNCVSSGKCEMSNEGVRNQRPEKLFQQCPAEQFRPIEQFRPTEQFRQLKNFKPSQLNNFVQTRCTPPNNFAQTSCTPLKNFLQTNKKSCRSSSVYSSRRFSQPRWLLRLRSRWDRPPPRVRWTTLELQLETIFCSQHRRRCRCANSPPPRT